MTSADSIPDIEGPAMNGQLSLRTTVLLLAGVGATYLALTSPSAGTALLVGIAVTALLHSLLDRA
ncbi:hypothetical protein ACKI10_45635 [Streptomyces galilaeus]